LSRLGFSLAGNNLGGPADTFDQSNRGVVKPVNHLTFDLLRAACEFAGFQYPFIDSTLYEEGTCPIYDKVKFGGCWVTFTGDKGEVYGAKRPYSPYSHAQAAYFKTEADVVAHKLSTYFVNHEYLTEAAKDVLTPLRRFRAFLDQVCHIQSPELDDRIDAFANQYRVVDEIEQRLLDTAGADWFLPRDWLNYFIYEVKVLGEAERMGTLNGPADPSVFG
jgi:hypothetical protein